MADVTAEPAALRAVGSQIDDLLSGAPTGPLDEAADCGSATVIAALADSTLEIEEAWRAAGTATARAGKAIVAAAEDYDTTDSAVARASASRSGADGMDRRR